MSVSRYDPTTGELIPIAGVPTQALAAKADLTVIAPAFSVDESYIVDDYVTHDGKLYRCTSPHTTGTWNPVHFTEIKVTDITGGSIILDDEVTPDSSNGVKSSGIYNAISDKVSATLDGTNPEILVFSTT